MSAPTKAQLDSFGRRAVAAIMAKVDALEISEDERRSVRRVVMDSVELLTRRLYDHAADK